MRFAWLFIVFMAHTISLNAQSKKKIARYGIIECVENKTILKDGNETQRYISEKTVWDKKANLILNEQFSKNGELESKESFVWKGKDIYEEKSEKLIKEKESKIKFNHTKYSYEKGVKTEEREFDKEGNLIKRTTFTYNRFGDKLQENEYLPTGDLIKTAKFSYDKKGLRIEKIETEKTQTGVNTEKTIYTYSFK